MKNLKIVALATFMLLINVSCKDYLDVNTNPNAPVSIDPNFVLSGALIETARIKYSADMTFTCYWGGYFAASGSFSQSGDQMRSYNLTNSGNPSATSFPTLFANANNYNFVQNAFKDKPGYEYYAAICKIMKVWDMHHLVDFYGNVPYTQALSGFVNLSPGYDDAKSIYESLSNELDQAVALIKAGTSATIAVPGTADVMFGGNMTKWAKLANTLRLRLLLRQSQIPSRDTYIQGEMAKITANAVGYLAAGETASIQPGFSKAQFGNQNPLWENMGLSVGDAVAPARDLNRVSNFFLNSFAGKNDPRLDYVVRSPGDKPGINSKSVPYKGIDFGALPAGDITSAATSGFGPGILSGPNQDAIFISSAQSYFLQAEAVQRGWITGNPQALYESGITEAFKQVGVPSATAAATYYSQAIANVGWAASTNKIQAIITQKWMANAAIDGPEAWADFKRLGFPVGVPVSIDPGKVSSIPAVRLLYPQNEYNTNQAAVNAQGTISAFTSKIFWHQ
jgi:hypothetical protein